MSVLATYVHAVEETLRERASRKLSAQEFERLHSMEPNAELIDGEVFMSPADLRHDKIAVALASEIRPFIKTQPVRIGEVYGSSAGFRLTERTIVSPDVSFVQLDKLPNGESPDDFANFAPDLAVEVISPYDREHETQEKVNLYLRFGTRLVWVIYPKIGTAYVHRPDGTAKRIQASEFFNGEDVLPGFSCKLSDIL